MLTVSGVTKAYDGKPALSGVSLALEAGQILALLGPNGAGKSTLISVIATLRKPDSGTVTVNGFDVKSDPDDARKNLGLVTQETGLYWNLTCRENLQFFAEVARLRGAAAKRRVAEVAEVFELTDSLDKKAANVSGGQARRLHSAIALMHRPPLLLMDEPTVGADIAARSRLLDAVNQLANDGTAVLYTTHYLPEVEELGADIAIIDQGRIIAEGSQEALLERHGQAQVEFTFVGDAPAANGAEPTGNLLRIPAAQPARAIPQLIDGLGDDAKRLDGVEIIRPNLDAVFLSLTGRRYDEDDISQSDSDEEVADVG